MSAPGGPVTPAARGQKRSDNSAASDTNKRPAAAGSASGATPNVPQRLLTLQGSERRRYVAHQCILRIHM